MYFWLDFIFPFDFHYFDFVLLCIFKKQQQRQYDYINLTIFIFQLKYDKCSHLICTFISSQFYEQTQFRKMSYINLLQKHA